jgi:hypothetical protein
MLAAAERDGSTKHREPQEQDRGELIRPDQRPMKAIARHHARKQDHDLGGDQQRGRNLDKEAKRAFDRRRE